MDSRVGRGGKERGGGGKRRLRFNRRDERKGGEGETMGGTRWGVGGDGDGGYTMKRKLWCFRFRLMFRIGIRD